MDHKILTFDIETIPDIESAKKIYEIDANDEDAWNIIRLKRMEKTGNDFMPHYLQKIVTISLVYQGANQMYIWSIGNEGESEDEIIRRFFSGLEKFEPTLVSWNGGGFDLPVLHYRSLLHHIAAPLYWENGEHRSDFKWNNYTSRYHNRHTDLMDVMSGFQNRAFAPLDELAQMLGLPGKIGLHGSEVYPAYLEGKIQEISDYCESDVLNTHLLYLRFLWCKGQLSPQQYVNLMHQLEAYILKQPLKTHWQSFLPYLQEVATTINA